jgi:excisionase family DNA binding protein
VPDRLGDVATAADLLEHPELGLQLTPEAAASALARVEGLAAVLRVAAAAPSRNNKRRLDDEGLVSAVEAAKRTGMSKRWLYAHADKLPFARRIGRAVRFSPAAIDRWLSSRKS